MADQIRIIDRFIKTKPFDLRALLRLATWGCAAAVALMLAVLSSGVGTKHQAFAPSTSGAIPQVPAATVQLTTRQNEPDKATRQLSETISGLTADRDRLAARIASLERSLEDVTGSFKQQAATPPPTPAVVPAQISVHAPTAVPAQTAEPGRESASAQTSVGASAPAPTPGPASSPTPSPPRGQTQPEKAPAATAPPNAATPSTATPPKTAPPAGAIAASPSTPAAPPPAAPARIASLPEAADTGGKSRIVDFGLDIGGATSFDGLRALWNSVRGNTADLFDDLHPMVAVRENKSRGFDLRLVVGPIASSEAATQMCATLLAARRFCQMTIFEGQPLPQASSVAEPGRAPPAPPRTSSQSKTVRPPAPRQ